MSFTLPWLRRLTPAQLLFNQFKLDTREKLIMFGRKIIASQAAAPIASSLYFIPTQTRLTWSYPKRNQVITSGYLGDAWDRLPVHIQNLLHHPVFGIHGQAAPLLWESIRHDTRRFLIGFFIVMIIGAYTVSLKVRERATPWQMIRSVPLAFAAALAVASPLIWVAVMQVPNWGISTSDAWLNDWIGKGLPVLIIGMISAIPARLIMARTFYTLQLISQEQKLTEGKTEQWWWKIVYPETYRNGYDYLIKSGHVAVKHGKYLTVFLVLSLPFWLGLLGFGAWNLYFGFAAGAH